MFKNLSFVLFTLCLFTFSLVAATEKEAFDSYQKMNGLAGSKTFLTKKERKELFTIARHNKIAAVEELEKYDPDGTIGFCFGRAMAVHLIAQRMGLSGKSIRKLFVVGDLRSGTDPEWRFHVTTLVLGEKDEWYAIDPIMEKPLAYGTPLKMDQWMSIVSRTWDKDGKAHFYMVDNSTIIPDLRVVPDLEKETGVHLIEVSFKPEIHPSDFKAHFESGHQYFRSLGDAGENYFTTVYEKKPEDRFTFLGTRINGKLYDFRNYFVDLFNDLKTFLNHMTIGEWS